MRTFLFFSSPAPGCSLRPPMLSSTRSLVNSQLALPVGSLSPSCAALRAPPRELSHYFATYCGGARAQNDGAAEAKRFGSRAGSLRAGGHCVFVRVGLAHRAAGRRAAGARASPLRMSISMITTATWLARASPPKAGAQREAGAARLATPGPHAACEPERDTLGGRVARGRISTHAHSPSTAEQTHVHETALTNGGKGGHNARTWGPQAVVCVPGKGSRPPGTRRSSIGGWPKSCPKSGARDIQRV